jgi:glycosyltransferase involved in cell wall biosynthesis
MIQVHFTPGDGKGWAIDEDLRQIRIALRGRIQEVPAARADILYCPFWAGLAFYPAALLVRRFVVCHADNPPFFYLKQGDFAAVQSLVDLWVARSREAYQQFRALSLPVEYVPYTTDPSLFRPLPNSRESLSDLRRKYGIPQNSYVISNFHRDTEGADLLYPKAQKCPELLAQIAARLHSCGSDVHVLLAGPRRHWIRRRLQEQKIPYTFVGREIPGDDFGVNILERKTLNELYAISNVSLVTSRWEGGPQSVMEAAAARCPILSTRVGLAMDLLEPECLFDCADEAVEKIQADQRDGCLRKTVEAQEARFHREHTTNVLTKRLPEVLDACRPLVTQKSGKSTILDLFLLWQHEITRRFAGSRIRTFQFRSFENLELPLADFAKRVAHALEAEGLLVTNDSSAVVVGCEEGGGIDLRLATASCAGQTFSERIPVVVPSVADAVILRQAGCRSPLVALPFLPPRVSFEPHLASEVLVAGEETSPGQVWSSLQSGIPVNYPRGGVLRELVFLAGLSFTDSCKDSVRLRAGKELNALSELIWWPGLDYCVSEFQKIRT